MKKSFDVEKFQRLQRAFAKARDWDQFHSPKNLCMALGSEVGELLELFQWLESKASLSIMKDPTKAEAVRDEIADILYYVIRLADILDVDLAKALDKKMKKNASKYPVALAKGNAKKYTELT